MILSRFRPIAFLVVVLLYGCSGTDTPGHDESNPEGFEDARVVNLSTQNRVILDGTIEEPEAVDVYELGPLSIGDQLAVRCAATADSSLDPMIAIFDENGYRVFWNDDVDIASNVLDAGIEGIIRYASDEFFLGVTSTNFGSVFSPVKLGEYQCTVNRTEGVGLQALQGQAVVLRWSASSNISVSGTDYGDLPEFDAANVDDAFDGQTEQMMAEIVSIVEDDFSEFDISVLTSDDANSGDAVTTVFFGVSTSQPIFGISDTIDFYNEQSDDNAIVFLQSFSGLSSNLQRTAQAIANVVSHEIGHTLGLMHTSDVTELMDTTGAAQTLLNDQVFGVADVFDFPIGQQNAPLLLDASVGSRDTAGVLKSLPVEDGYYYCGTCGARMAVE